MEEVELTEENKKLLEACNEIRSTATFTVSKQAMSVMEKIPDFPYDDFAVFMAERKFNIGGGMVFEYLDRYYPSFQDTKSKSKK